jgi:mRNA interferase RelE/StbE
VAHKKTTDEFARILTRFPQKDLQRIINHIDLLKEDPRPPDCEKLSSQERYRVRQGNYPIVYSTQDDVLTGGVVKIDRRRDVYR